MAAILGFQQRLFSKFVQPNGNKCIFAVTALLIVNMRAYAKKRKYCSF